MKFMTMAVALKELIKMKFFTEINKKYSYDYLTTFWLHKSIVLEKALQILYDTVIIGDTVEMIGNIKKYLKHLKEYNLLCHGFKKAISILEWGGGLGMMCNIIMKKYKNIQTYVIIDIPIMIYIQRCYFALKKIPIYIVKDNRTDIKPGINLVSLSFIKKLKFNPDMFLSTWAISESGKKSLQYAYKHRFFNCEYLLIAHNRHRLEDFPDSPLYGIKNCLKIKIDEDNEYIFR